MFSDHSLDGKVDFVLVGLILVEDNSVSNSKVYGFTVLFPIVIYAPITFVCADLLVSITSHMLNNNISNFD